MARSVSHRRLIAELTANRRITEDVAKFGFYTWNDHQAEDQSEQSLLNADLVHRLIPDKRVRVQFAVITKAKAPKVQLLEVRFDESKLERAMRVFESVWSAIQSGHFYPRPSPMQCPGCGYRNQCAE